MIIDVNKYDKNLYKTVTTPHRRYVVAIYTDLKVDNHDGEPVQDVGLSAIVNDPHTDRQLFLYSAVSLTNPPIPIPGEYVQKIVDFNDKYYYNFVQLAKDAVINYENEAKKKKEIREREEKNIDSLKSWDGKIDMIALDDVCAATASFNKQFIKNDD